MEDGMTKAEMRDRIALLEQIALGLIRLLKHQELIGADDAERMTGSLLETNGGKPGISVLTEIFERKAMRMFEPPAPRQIGAIADDIAEDRRRLDAEYEGKE